MYRQESVAMNHKRNSNHNESLCYLGRPENPLFVSLNYSKKMKESGGRGEGGAKGAIV